MALFHLLLQLGLHLYLLALTPTFLKLKKKIIYFKREGERVCVRM